MSAIYTRVLHVYFFQEKDMKLHLELLDILAVSCSYVNWFSLTFLCPSIHLSTSGNSAHLRAVMHSTHLRNTHRLKGSTGEHLQDISK